jgi:hypothetical protein
MNTFTTNALNLPHTTYSKDSTIKCISLEEIWASDKALLPRELSSKLSESTLPTQEDVLSLDRLNRETIIHPKAPLSFNQAKEYAHSSLPRIIKDLEIIWECKLPSPPNLEIVPHPNYKSRFNQLNREECTDFGLTPKTNEIFMPTAYFPYKNLLLFPGMNLYENPNGKITPIAWDKEFLDFALLDLLSHVFMASIRKEQNEQSLARLLMPEEFKLGLYNLGLSLSQIVKEGLSQVASNHALHTLGNKAVLFWHPSPDGEAKLPTYRAALSLLKHGKKLYQIAALDHLTSNATGQIYYSFWEKHPFAEDKKRLFDSI